MDWDVCVLHDCCPRIHVAQPELVKTLLILKKMHQSKTANYISDTINIYWEQKKGGIDHIQTLDPINYLCKVIG